ncbi:MAG: type II toxin-antitoxin system prevent-host-death family antitoxin [Planctomycetes bacterium]|nr:type II toxin-antitoxin system prevent-host-death family antitoxin [Planctomycetota bacterium]
MERVRLTGERIIVERAGRPMVAIVPIEFYESWERRRQELFAIVDQVRHANRRASPSVIESEVAAAQQAVRRRPK